MVGQGLEAVVTAAVTGGLPLVEGRDRWGLAVRGKGLANCQGLHPGWLPGVQSQHSRQHSHLVGYFPVV
ncbi:hypothetical protein [Neosynechococcus sphagnicola]|uniref:hypothetical protein n=1 Tax=Neosynechococcus sphagnicola TaxID=1501145 RepID=UPI0019553DF8|nr:hypothetical protein [Neosynechococcus sphagnicola]